MDLQENTKEMPKVPKRILTSLLASVSAGVVPRAGVFPARIAQADDDLHC